MRQNALVNVSNGRLELEFRFFVFGYWLSVIGDWLLAIRHWLLVIGDWLLVIGYW